MYGLEFGCIFIDTIVLGENPLHELNFGQAQSPSLTHDFYPLTLIYIILKP